MSRHHRRLRDNASFIPRYSLFQFLNGSQHTRSQYSARLGSICSVALTGIPWQATTLHSLLASRLLPRLGRFDLLVGQPRRQHGHLIFSDLASTSEPFVTASIRPSTSTCIMS